MKYYKLKSGIPVSVHDVTKERATGFPAVENWGPGVLVGRDVGEVWRRVSDWQPGTEYLAEGASEIVGLTKTIQEIAGVKSRPSTNDDSLTELAVSLSVMDVSELSVGKRTIAFRNELRKFFNKDDDS